MRTTAEYATCCFEQVLEVARDKTAAVRPLASHLANHPSRTNKTCRYLRNKDGRMGSVLLWFGLVGWVLWHINFVGYLTPNPFLCK